MVRTGGESPSGIPQGEAYDAAQCLTDTQDGPHHGGALAPDVSLASV